MREVTEIYVGVTVDKNPKGEVVTGSIYFNGKPISRGVYDREHLPIGLPRGWGWNQFRDRAIERDGQGVTVFYSDADKPEVRKAIKEQEAADKENAKLQAKALVDMEKADNPKVELKRPEVNPNG